MNNCIHLQFPNAKTRLLSVDSESGESTLSFGRGRSVTYDPSTEAEYCTLVYTPDLRENLTSWLNNTFGFLEPDEIEDFYRKFREAHPLTPVENALLSMEPIAGEDTYCELFSPMFKDSVKLTLAQEKWLLEFVKYRLTETGIYSIDSREKPTLEEVMMEWFEDYRKHYGVCARYKKDMKYQDSDLAYRFCMAHGIDWNYVRNTKIKTTTRQYLYGFGERFVILGVLGTLCCLGNLALIGIFKEVQKTY